MKRVSVIGHFAHGFEYMDGQTVKTRIVTDELIRSLGEDQVLCLDTHGGIKTLIKSPFVSLNAMRQSKHTIILPAHNGLRVFGRLLPLFRHFYKDRQIHYIVIGGWLSEFLKKRPLLKSALKKLDGIYVETTSMKIALEEQGFENIVVMPNCKNLTILKESELVYPEGEPYKLCIFSRVMKEKGVEDAVNAVKVINESVGRVVYSLDIYGPVDSGQVEWFENLKASFPDYVKYCGIVQYDKSVEVLKNYFALLFPTKFYTEGVPGTLIDAYASGVPVITSLWMNSADVFKEDICGFGYEFDDADGLFNILMRVKDNPEELLNKKKKCLDFAKNYTSETVVKILSDRLI